ncbi:MAG: flagellar basal body L-ring protein FlgH [Pseudomonadota bacterium]|nr:flagellar basal body L-ring protein FlgH [Pseudomonadota bacterium]
MDGSASVSRLALAGTILSSLVGLTGCAASSGSFAPLPEYPYTAARPVAPVAPDGAIYKVATSQFLFEDERARRVGDVLTIRLVENTTASKEANTEITKESGHNIANPTLFGSSVAFDTPGIVPFASNKDNNLGFDAQADHEFTGEAESDQSNSLFGDVTAVVVAVQPNGNLVIRGEKIVTLNRGDERLGIVGEVRAADIEPDNSVPSTRVANARIVYDGRGELADANAMGWLGRFFLSALMPF